MVLAHSFVCGVSALLKAQQANCLRNASLLLYNSVGLGAGFARPKNTGLCRALMRFAHQSAAHKNVILEGLRPPNLPRS